VVGSGSVIGLAATGQREAAAALGLIGLNDKKSVWTVSVDDPSDVRSGARRLTAGRTTALPGFVRFNF
jgi:hypothetical protein